MDKMKLLITFIVIVGVIGGGLYWIAANAGREKKIKIEQLNKGYGYGKGIIVDKKFYKGHSIEVRYQISGKEYTYSGGWDKNPRNLNVRDSIEFKYALDTPVQIITELNNEYE
ncbi:hypothetical protein KTO58_26595 [Chitinophaga pendula]|uniref:hypothetical protein n=1 Tax=Chitinophaga TaxID=79328 RepID=UPI000BAF7B10|nr:MULTISPECIES: hypothetical protein [Chitinophaga]ASZ09867.1 hypothetical protein CK934_02170 [Chitinophaga sp. MD30]UCJ07191.1 hypothetical protein KTO58_26595 [Chitinophaga pendula]